MNLIVNHIPPNWEPGNPEAIARWMERLPPNQNIETLLNRDEHYDKTRTTATI